MRKYEIARLLGKRYGYTSYLEICTPTTGGTFSQVDKLQFPRRVRVVYKNQPMFSDGEQIDFSTESENGDGLFGKLIRSGEKFDLVFIDSYHTYAASLRDLVYGMQLVNQNGIILIHDCFPPNIACTTPEYIRGEWCGLTFAAFLDIVLFTEGIHYITIDSDYGCGVVSKDNRLSQFSNPPADPKLLLEWRMLPLLQKYPFFESHHRELLHLISAEEFVASLFGESAEAGIDNPAHPLPDLHINNLILAKIALEDAQSKNNQKYIQNVLALLRKIIRVIRRIIYKSFKIS
jgi:hypothetical protein